MSTDSESNLNFSSSASEEVAPQSKRKGKEVAGRGTARMPAQAEPSSLESISRVTAEGERYSSCFNIKF